MLNKQNKLKFFKSIFSYIISLLIFTLALTGCSSYTSYSSLSGDYLTDVLRVHYIDVGQADSILIQTPDNKNMLIDAGQTKDNAILSYLDTLNITKLDFVIATHPHSDHISEMDDIINNYEIDNFYIPKVSHTSKDFENMIDALNSKNIAPIATKAGMQFNLTNDIYCDILAPCSDDYDNLNNYSIVAKITYGENSFLFTGDAESLSEKEILNSGTNISADVLKVGHHGSSTSTTKNFLSAVNPQYCVISCAENNDYSHPHKEIIERLNGTNTFITKDYGTIVITSDSKNINVYTAENSQSYETNNSPSAVENNLDKESSTTDEKNYIGNISSKKYHHKNCSQLPNENNRIYFNSQNEAEKNGYSAHKNCIN